MSDNTNDTYIDEDADGTPCLWLHNPENGRSELLASKDDVRVMVNLHKPNASWGAPSRHTYVDRLWDAIASTVRPSVGESARAESAPAGEDAIDALVTEFAPWDGIIQRQRLREFAARVLEVGGQQPGVPVEKVREVVEFLRGWANQEGRLVTSAYAYNRSADYMAKVLLPKEPTS